MKAIIDKIKLAKDSLDFSKMFKSMGSTADVIIFKKGSKAVMLAFEVALFLCGYLFISHFFYGLGLIENSFTDLQLAIAIAYHSNLRDFVLIFGGLASTVSTILIGLIGHLRNQSKKIKIEDTIIEVDEEIK